MQVASGWLNSYLCFTLQARKAALRLSSGAHVMACSVVIEPAMLRSLRKADPGSLPQTEALLIHDFVFTKGVMFGYCNPVLCERLLETQMRCHQPQPTLTASPSRPVSSLLAELFSPLHGLVMLGQPLKKPYKPRSKMTGPGLFPCVLAVASTMLHWIEMLISREWCSIMSKN